MESVIWFQILGEALHEGPLEKYESISFHPNNG